MGYEYLQYLLYSSLLLFVHQLIDNFWFAIYLIQYNLGYIIALNDLFVNAKNDLETTIEYKMQGTVAYYGEPIQLLTYTKVLHISVARKAGFMLNR